MTRTRRIATWALLVLLIPPALFAGSLLVGAGFGVGMQFGPAAVYRHSPALRAFVSSYTSSATDQPQVTEVKAARRTAACAELASRSKSTPTADPVAQLAALEAREQCPGT